MNHMSAVTVNFREFPPVEFFPWNSTGGSVGLLGNCRDLSKCNRQCCIDRPSIINNDDRSENSHELDLLNPLNENFTLEELTVTIKKLQNKKSVANNLICKEMLKNSNKYLL